ncbi:MULTISPECIES: 30S ribosomal protein S8e [Salinibaculum]|uniref:30S ribosomal protein S8e n=1 Tax=Salinibaculum TaxID=2732368 RepID=UPI0030CE7D48
MKYQGPSPRKRTGGRRRPANKKKKHQLGSEFTETQVGDAKFKTVDARGNTEKVRTIAQDTASVAIDGEVVAADIEDVTENDSNPNYVRRNIITKGAIIETSEGRARVTSRPGQDGQINAVLVEE